MTSCIKWETGTVSLKIDEIWTWLNSNLMKSQVFKNVKETNKQVEEMAACLNSELMKLQVFKWDKTAT